MTPDDERLVRMETKLDLTLAQWNDGFKDHEIRLRSLESETASNSAINRWKATTGCAIVLALVGIAPWVASLVS